MEKIKQWLNSGTDYWEGVALYEAHCTNDFLLRQLKKAHHSFNYKKLTAELSALLPEKDSHGSCLTNHHDTANPSPGSCLTNHPQTTETPPEILALMDQRRIIHTELWHKSSEYERKVGCFAILSKSDKISRHYSGLEEEETPAPEPLPESGAELIARRNTNRAYISKNQKKENKQAEVQRRLNENKEIEKLINGNR